MNLRQIARHMYLSGAGYFCTPQLGVHILNGHMLTRGVPNGQSQERFENQLYQLSKYCRFIRFEEAVRLISSKECFRVSDSLVAFTFDDGFEEDYLYLAPILEEFDTNAAFFINPNYVDGNDAYIDNFNTNVVMTSDKRPMRWPQIIDLYQRGHIIGAHTLDHYKIASDDDDELRHQIIDCKTIIEEKLGCECDYFAFPYGRLEHANKKSIDIATSAYRYVFSQSDYKHYFSFNGGVINRRHFEPFWPVSHVKFFLNCKKS